MTLRILSWLALSSFGVIGTVEAQWLTDCQAPQPPSLGVSIGRSLPGFELHSEAAQAHPAANVSVRAATQLAGRADLSVIGPLRLRIEGATAHWDVRQTRYDADNDYRVTDESSIGSMSARHFVALAGIRTGRPGSCAHVSVGGGLYSISFRNATLRRPGLALAAGIEIPAGRHGAIQVDATLHVISVRDGYPITSYSDALTMSLLVGWAYRF